MLITFTEACPASGGKSFHHKNKLCFKAQEVKILIRCIRLEFHPIRSVFVGAAAPHTYPAHSVWNRLILAQSDFTGTAKQKNNSKVCLSRKPMWKFNKWLFPSQCSHNWWFEMGIDVRRRFWINCHQNLCGSMCQSLWARGTAHWNCQCDKHKPNLD